jgi:ubiquinone biosynthesis protein
VVREWLTRNLGPAGLLEDAAEGAGELGRFLATVPSLLARARRLAEKVEHATGEGLTLAADTVEAIGAAHARRNRGTTIALWAIAVLLALLLFWR